MLVFKYLLDASRFQNEAISLCCVVFVLIIGGCTQTTSEPASVQGSRAYESPVPTTPSTGADAEVAVLEPLSAPLNLREESNQLGSEIVTRLPQQPDAWEVKARFHFLFGQTQLAAESWQTALKLAPGYAYALQGLARTANLNGDYEQAIKLLTQPDAQTWENAEATYVLADSYLKSARMEESSRTLRQFLEKQPGNYLSWVLLGQSCLAQSQLTDAEQAFRRALELKPNFPQAQLGLGTVLLRRGEREEAQRLLAEQRLARVDIDQAEQDSSNSELEQCAERWVMAARVYQGAQLWPAALQTARRAVELDPGSGDALQVLVELLERQNKISEAAEEIGRFIAQSPGDASAQWLLRLGVLLAKHGQLDQARNTFLELSRVAPRDPQGPESVVRLSIRMGVDLPQTMELAEKVVELRGSAADYELLAQTYAVNAQWDQAHQALTNALRLAPENADYKAAMRQLEQAMKQAR